jgi:hypothetical protein
LGEYELKSKCIDADALLGYLQAKWDSNRRLNEETLKRLGQHVNINRTTLLIADFTSIGYRQLLDSIFEEGHILDAVHSSSELIMMIARQFELKLNYK